ncbi:MAG: hypothetical protein ACF8XB_03810 [Planctomycetota bacterium JB042]
MSADPSTVAPALVALKEIATCFFFAFFLVLVGWLLFSRSDRFRRSAEIPLHDDRVVEPRAERSNDD